MTAKILDYPHRDIMHALNALNRATGEHQRNPTLQTKTEMDWATKAYCEALRKHEKGKK